MPTDISEAFFEEIGFVEEALSVSDIIRRQLSKSEQLTIEEKTTLSRLLPEIISITEKLIRILAERITITETFQRNFSLGEELSISDVIRRFPSLVETITLSERLFRIQEEIFAISENFTRKPLRLESLGITERFTHSLTLIETMAVTDRAMRLLLENMNILDTITANLFRKYVEELMVVEKSVRVFPIDFPPPGWELYDSIKELLSLAVKQAWEEILSEKFIDLIGGVVSGKQRRRFSDLVHSLGTHHKSEPLWQKYAGNIENWTNIYYNKPDWLEGYFVRQIFVDHKRIIFILLRPFFTEGTTRATDQYSCRVVVLDLSGPQPTVEALQEFPLLNDARDKFGYFEQGHGMVVGVVGNQAFGLTYADTLGQISFLRFPYISEEYKEVNPEHSSILRVPEGFLFLPVNILYDLETYHNLPSLDTTQFHQPIYPNKPIILSRGFGGIQSIASAKVWYGTGIQFREATIQSSAGANPAPALFGDIIQNKWVTWGLTSSLIEENLLYSWEWAIDPTTSQDKVVINKLPQPFFPLPTVGIWTYLPLRETNKWIEILLNFASNNDVGYFTRLWHRVYRAQLTTEEGLKVTETLAFDALLDSFEIKTQENPLLPFIAYDKYYGIITVVMASMPPADPTLVVATQNLSYSPPPTPDLLFPLQGWTISRRPIITIRPAVYAYPQEFLIRLIPAAILEGLNISPLAAPGYEFLSQSDRTGWYVSYDGGTTWQQMTGPISRTDPSQDIRVQLRLQYSLPEGGNFYIAVAAYSFLSSV